MEAPHAYLSVKLYIHATESKFPHLDPIRTYNHPLITSGEKASAETAFHIGLSKNLNTRAHLLNPMPER